MTTNVSFQNPSIKLLCEAVERKLGHTIHSLAEIQDLAEEHLKFQVSEITIRRLWGLRADGYNTIRRSTLDTLAQFAGYANFDAFEQYLQQNHVESADIAAKDTILTSSLHEGDMVILTWPPDRCCKLLYQGNNQFLITEVEKSHRLRVGCTFTVQSFILNQPLYLNNLCFPDSADEHSTYGVAYQNGLSSIDVMA